MIAQKCRELLNAAIDRIGDNDRDGDLTEFSKLVLQQAELHCEDVAEVECTEMRKTYMDSENTTFTFTPNRLREFVRVLLNVSMIHAMQQDDDEEEKH